MIMFLGYYCYRNLGFHRNRTPPHCHQRYINLVLFLIIGFSVCCYSFWDSLSIIWTTFSIIYRFVETWSFSGFWKVCFSFPPVYITNMQRSWADNKDKKQHLLKKNTKKHTLKISQISKNQLFEINFNVVRKFIFELSICRKKNRLWFVL